MARPLRCFGAAVLALAVMGCSPKAEKPAGGPVRIRVSGAEGQNSATPFFAAMQLGYFKAAGLDVSFTTMSGGASALDAALSAGEVDVGMGSAFQWMEGVAKGAIKGKIVGELTDNNYVILGRAGITDLRQLKGKIFAVSVHGAGDEVFAQAVLSHFGIGADDAVWLPLGDPPSRLAALIAKRVDGTELSLTNVPERAKGQIIMMPEQSPVPFVSNVLFARQGLIDSDKPALQKFAAAIGKAADWIRAHPDQAVKPCMASGTEEAACKNSIRLALSSGNAYTWSPTTKVNADGIAAMVPIVAKTVPKAATMDVKDLVDGSVASAK